MSTTGNDTQARGVESQPAPDIPGLARRRPGTQGIWVFVFADMTVFGVIFACFMSDRHHNERLFDESQRLLNQNLGGINTLILLTSSWFAALGVIALRRTSPAYAGKLFGLAALCGVAFSASKIFEYSEKLNAGISLVTNDFFMYYFVLTGMHLLHVVGGSVLMVVLWLRTRSSEVATASITGYESGTIFWHMVDLLWVVIFPLLYLIK